MELLGEPDRLVKLDPQEHKVTKESKVLKVRLEMQAHKDPRDRKDLKVQQVQLE